MNRIDGQYFVVDSQNVEKSYVATTGKVYPEGTIVIPNAQNNERANIYSFEFELEDELPKAGYIQIDMPESVKLSPSTTQSSGSCKDYTCIDATESTVIFLMQEGWKANTRLTLRVGGITNPRSFKPTDKFTMTTLDTDQESQIDSGYDLTATMVKAGEISSFSA